MCSASAPNLKYEDLHTEIKCKSSEPSQSVDRVDQNNIVKRSRSRKVRFREGLHNTIEVEIIGTPFTPASEMTADEKEKIWWDQKSLEYFKQTALYVTEGVQLRQDKNPFSYPCVLTRTYSICCLNQPVNNELIEEKDQKILEQWARIGHCRRGLEKWSIPAIGKERLRRKYIAIHGVLEIQKLLNAENKFHNDIKIDMIRRASENLSRPAMKFARLMGQADAVVSQDNKNGLKRL